MPTPAANHPGNVFLRGERVSVPVPEKLGARVTRWQALDDKGSTAARGAIEGATIRLGALGVGWYRIEFLGADGQPVGWTTAAVLERLGAPVPQDSPICADSATAWFARRYKQDMTARQEVFANLAALAGMNWIRDRLAWGHIERSRGQFSPETYYDTSAALQTDQGLKVLQVFHSTPGWAIDKKLDGSLAYKRFPRDLRVVHSFCQAMAKRFSGRVRAWEPWNEANISGFGGHTIDEMATMQKAAYWGFKAGEPDVVVCWNVFAGPGSALHTEGVIENVAWPYFETYNIHTYRPPERYLDQFDTARRGACGRPIWLTECGIRLRWETERPWGEVSRESEQRQAEFIARSYASSLFAGVSRHFFFILGNYVERQTQFGLLRHDQTPRPGYVALAAVGRLLSGARALGRVAGPDPKGCRIYAFRAQPDGQEREVLVAWALESQDWPANVKVAPTSVFDYLGRPLAGGLPQRLGPAPVFVLLPSGQGDAMPLEPPPPLASCRSGKPCRVVLQAHFPAGATVIGSQAHRVVPGTDVDIPVDMYNFSDQPLTGTVRVASAPSTWLIAPREWQARLEPLARERVVAKLVVPAKGRELLRGGAVKLVGDFGAAGQSVLWFRLIGDLGKLEPSLSQPIPQANRAERWVDNIIADSTMSHRQHDPGGVLFEMQFQDADPWAYPRLRLQPQDAPRGRVDGLALTVQVLEGTGTVRVQFVEDSGASYVVTVNADPDAREPQRVVGLFEHAKWGAFSKPDPDGQISPGKLHTVLVGINSRRRSKVRMVVRDLAWVAY